MEDKSYIQKAGGVGMIEETGEFPEEWGKNFTGEREKIVSICFENVT